MKQIQKLKIELIAAIVSLMIAAVGLTSATYAWYVTNNTVKGTTSTISASTNGFILQIATLEEGAQHGGEQKSLEAFTTGSTLSPASTDDLFNWYICQGWDNQGKVTSYSTPRFESGNDAKPGNYKVNGSDYYAFIRSDYIVYTITETGMADVYLDASEGAPISVTATNGSGSTTVTDSIRVAITTETLDSEGNPTGNESELRIVYAVKNETGKGNDSTGIDGWTSIQNDSGIAKLGEVTYPYIYEGHYTDQRVSGAKNWAATKSGDNFVVPSDSEAVATNVGYDGIIIHVYIWMEGTDADCVNGKSIEDDPSSYNVTVKLAGVGA
ncbi:MAG: hypothetical protein ACI4FY_01145 [Acetatifactor sp.]